MLGCILRSIGLNYVFSLITMLAVVTAAFSDSNTHQKTPMARALVGALAEYHRESGFQFDNYNFRLWI